MNYRHGFHAANFADVHKHAVLCRIILHLREKAAAFRVIDTHAGAGQTDLRAEEATRTGEWREGIGRLAFSGNSGAPLAEPARALLSPYLDSVAACNAGGGLATYPGSPALALRALRRQDRLIATECEPHAARRLQAFLHGDARAKAIAIDGWTALSAYLPPPERRGLVLIDPPFEERDEFERLARAFAAAWRKWQSGIFLLWYPLKAGNGAEQFIAQLRAAAIPKLLRSELRVAAASTSERLTGSGLIVCNPPWRLRDELAILVPALAAVLAQDAGAGGTLDWLHGER